MTATAERSSVPASASWEADGAKYFDVAWAIAKRNLLSITRLPSAFIPSLVFPVMIIVALSGSYSGVAKVPGFPTKNMVSWIIGFALVQACAIAGMTTGLGLIRDLETKFYDRFLLAPVKRSALIIGLFIAVSIRVAVPFTLIFGLAFAQGARFRSSFLPGLLCLLAASEGAALIGSGWGIGMGLRLKTFAAAPLMFMAVFLAVFLAPVQVPLSFMTGWLHHVATVNPVTRIMALARAGFIGPITGTAVWQGLVVIVPGILLLSWFALRGMRKLEP